MLTKKLLPLIASLALSLALLGSAGCVQVTGATNDQGAPSASDAATTETPNSDATSDSETSSASDSSSDSGAEPTPDAPAGSDSGSASNAHHNSSHDEHDYGHDYDHDYDHHLSFRNHHALEEHFEKHGAEVGCATVDDYLAAANAVIANPDALHKLEAEDGDDVYFLESTGEFVVVSPDGYIRTYFITDRDYFDRQ